MFSVEFGVSLLLPFHRGQFRHRETARLAFFLVCFLCLLLLILFLPLRLLPRCITTLAPETIWREIARARNVWHSGEGGGKVPDPPTPGA